MAPMAEPAVDRILAILDDEMLRVTSYIARLHDEVSEQLRDVGRRRVLLSSIEKRVEVIARDCLVSAGAALNGAGFIAGTDVFTDAPALAWWYRPGSEHKVERLVVDADFYDYTSAQWWTEACSDRVTAAGPYVDASGTNQYVVTFSRRLELDERLAGVAATDVLVGHFQGVLQRALLDLPPGTSVTDTEGAVIATNTGRLLGETRSPSEPASRVVPARSLGWLLHIGVGDA
jgi:hypothetical protein